ncbi:Amino acid/polyamine transporter I [Lasallia pustulata]|uniref:Amino acid/polyamine transporter I n=1 Tax=Lasallia pustulata TaxID=136370 RepID=A0A1W5CVF2_9LECA|nr:Amino acid/polyamine transporter I [Lasallia pustulata]
MATTPLEKTELRGRNGNKMADDAAIIEESGSLDSGRNKDSVVMARMGKKQQLNRSFGFIPVLALSSTVLSSWESICATFAAGLVNGGSVALVYGFILAAIGTMCLAASLAEMASITPISGAQYHWTAQFAPKRAAAFVSWMQGE